MEEIELIEQVQQGNMQAFEQLFEQYQPRAMKTIYLMAGQSVICEDIVQETFVTCYRSIKGLKHPQYFKTWFFKILTRTAWKHLKKEKQLVPVEDIQERIESQSRQGESEGQLASLYEEILKLDDKLQMTIILYYYNDLSVKEIAKIMGCFEGTVKSRLHTARTKLKDGLTVLADSKEV